MARFQRERMEKKAEKKRESRNSTELVCQALPMIRRASRTSAATELLMVNASLIVHRPRGLSDCQNCIPNDTKKLRELLETAASSVQVTVGLPTFVEIVTMTLVIPFERSSWPV